MSKEKAWERHKGESEKAYEAFSLYRDMGEKRTLTAVAEKLRKSGSLIRRWKDKFDWYERVRLFDNDVEKKAMAKVVEERKKMIERHIGLSMNIQAKALQALQLLSAEELSVKDIREYIKLGTELERISRTLNIEKENCTSIIFKGEDSLE